MATSALILHHRRPLHTVFRRSLYHPHAWKTPDAVVYTPRERDRQRNEVIVDNNTVTGKSIYLEEKSRKGKWKTSPLPGFARKRSVYTDGQNPFRDGTARFAATEKKPEKAFAHGFPIFPKQGNMPYTFLIRHCREV